MYNDLKSAIEFFKNDKFAASTGVEILSVETGRAVCALEISQGHVNSDGFVQGGAIFTLADSAFAVAANLGTAADCGRSLRRGAVSYTHLTLPTSDLV